MPGRRDEATLPEPPPLDTWEEVCRAVGASTAKLFEGPQQAAKGVDLDRPHRVLRLAGAVDWDDLDFTNAEKRPHQIGDYIIKRTIGKGLGGGAVYLAEHYFTWEKAAVKWPLPAEELGAWARVQQRLPGLPGLPQLLAAGAHEGERYAVTNLLGADLTKVSQRFDATDRQRRWRAVRVLGRMVLRRLEALHSVGIVHCDVSPYNVLLGRVADSEGDNATPYLIDFGLSRCWPGAGRLGAEHGTAEFASVRAAEGGERRPVDDLEALGWTMAWLVFGSLPWCEWQFEMPVHLELVARIRAAKLRLFREGWATLRGLEPRWAKAAEMPAQLGSFITECDSTAARPTPPHYQLLAALLGGRPGLGPEEAEREDLREFRAHVWPML